MGNSWRTAWALFGLALAAAAGSTAPYTAHFGGLQEALEARRSVLLEEGSSESLLAADACDRSLLLLLGYSPSVAKDLALAGKVAKTLQKRFPPEDPLLDEIGAALDGLEGEVEAQRAVLVVEISLLSGAVQAAASKGLAASDVLLGAADLALTPRDRAKGLAKALKKILATRGALRKGATPGIQGPLNPSFETWGSNGAQVRNASYTIVGNLKAWYDGGNGFAQTGVAVPHGSTTGALGCSYVSTSGYYPGGLYQDGVNLSKSRRLLFDYSMYGQSPGPCSTTGEYGYARLELRFSSPSGPNVVLWRRDQQPNGVDANFSVGVTTAEVDLPFLPEPGRLVISAEFAANPNPCPPPPPPQGGGSQPTPSPPNRAFSASIDNFRVE